ncbi:hypothetical protein EMCRGX_G017579 [Ephydatia muelleri]|eukprot:Em0012g108a
MFVMLLLVCILAMPSGPSATFTLTPINTTVCSGSTVQFVCSATDVTTVSFFLNSKSIPPLPPNIYISDPTFTGGATIRNMSISNASANAVITCRAYLVIGAVLTRAAYLTVQGPPSAPTDLIIITYNDTATLLVWGPPPDAQSPSLLSYAVVIRNGSGAPVYSETVREPQLDITTPDPCGHYEATVTPMCGTQTTQINLGDIPTSSPITFYSHPLSPSDNVTVNISLPFSSKVCYYKMVALSAYEMLSFPSVKPLPSLYKDQSTITVSLPPNKHFNLTITAYNGYGNTSTTVAISTFDVVGVSVNTSSLVCLFNTGSLARGCLVYLTDTDTGVTYCRVVWRSLDTPVNMSLCPSSNGPLSTWVYSVEVYDIESDGSVSSVPALAGEVVTVFGPSTVYGPSLEDGHQIASCGLSTHCGPSVMQGQSGRSSLYYVGVGIGAGGGGAVMVTASVMILVLCLIRVKKQKISAQKSDPLTVPNTVYGITVKCSDDTKMTDNPVYGAKEDAY